MDDELPEGNDKPDVRIDLSEMGCLVICIGIALAIAAPAIVKIIEAFR